MINQNILAKAKGTMLYSTNQPKATTDLALQINSNLTHYNIKEQLWTKY
uniref:Uncharacterized protein n=1 Tax=Arundo donax TaxID=35708 RepID=A0A0A9CZH6_ARUDO